MKAHLDQVVKLLDLDAPLNIELKRKRCTLPTAYYGCNSGRIVVVGNPASLIRYALLQLIVHELSHHDYLKLVDEPPDGYDYHDDPLFLEIEEHYQNQITELMVDEHDQELL